MNEVPIESIVLSGSAPAFRLDVLPAATERRDALLVSARRGRIVNSDESAQRAADLLRELSEFADRIEAGRVETKAPILEIGRAIDTTAKGLVSEILTELDRISMLVGAWESDKRAKAEEARRAAYLEEQRLRRIAEEEERQKRVAEEAERLRIAQETSARQAELEAKALRARSAERKAELEAAAEAARIKGEADAKALAEKAKDDGLRRDEELAQAIGKTQATALALAPHKIEGVSVRTRVEYRVTDIVALYEAQPVLVKMSENKAALLSALKQLKDGESLPGVEHWKVSLANSK